MRNKIRLSLFLTLLIIGAQGEFASVYASPVSFTYSGVCLGKPTFFSGSVTGITADTWTWDFGDGTFGYGQNADHVYLLANTTPGFTVTLTVKDTLGVTYTSVPKIVVIQPLPIPFFSFDTPGCSKDSIQFINLSTPSAGHYISQWTWNFDDGTPLETYVSGDDPKLKHAFASDRIFDVTLTVMNSVNSCENTISRAVTVTPPPIADFNSIGICQNQAVQFTDASSVNGSVDIAGWKWDFGDPGSGTSQNTSMLPDPTHIYTQPGPYTIRLIVANSNSCSDTVEKHIFIHSSPAVSFTNAPVCLNQEFTFNPDPLITNLPSIATWKWDFGDVSFSNEASNSHTYWAPADYVVILKVSDTNGCLNEATKTIKVNPLPVAQFSTYQSYCTGAEVQFQDLSSPSTGFISNWAWDFGDGQKFVTSQSGSTISHVYALATSYMVTLTVKSSDGCTGKGTNALIINSNPIANFDFTQACVGSPTAFTDLTQLNGAGTILNWHWDFGDSLSGIPNTSDLTNPAHTFVAPGNSQVTLIVNTSNGCGDTITRIKNINSPPPVNFNTSSNCQNKEMRFIPDALVMNLATITSWYWDFGNGIAVTPNPTHTFTSAGPHNVSLTVTDTSGCSNTIIKQIIIASEPTVNFSFPQPACKGSLIQIDNLSSVPGGYIVKNEWDFGDGKSQVTTTLESVYHTYASSNTYIVTLTVTSNDGCEKKLSVPVFVLPKPSADFTFSGTCQGSAVQFSDLSLAGTGTIIYRTWKFGDPTSGINNTSSANSPDHTYDTSGTFPVSLIVSNSGGCYDTIVKQVLIHTMPVVDFTSSTGCVNEPTHFTSSVLVNAGAIVSRLWDFGDGNVSSDFDPSNTYVLPGPYTVTLVVTDTTGCVNFIKHTVVIAESPSASFVVASLTCAGNPTLLTVLPSASGIIISTYFWQFGDGSDTLINAPASGNVYHTYASGNNYTAVLTVKTASGCEAQSQRTFTVSSAPIAKFSSGNSCTGAAVNFTDLSQLNSGPTIVNRSWNFNDPASFTNNTSAQPNPFHVFNSPGTYKVVLQVGNSSGCSDTVSNLIIIKPKPIVDFDWKGTCNGNPTLFTINSSVTNIADIISYDWDFGDGTPHSANPNPVHPYSSTGNHTVILTIVNKSGCQNTVSHILNISPQPIAVFSSHSSCLGTETQFTDQSYAANGESISAWHWDFGVNNELNDTSSQQNPGWIYKAIGVYQVKLTVTSQNGCQGTVKSPSQVFGNPTANFTYIVSPCGNGAVYFQDSSYNKQAPISSYLWEFESNHTSDLQDPVYVYYSSDSCYDVRLIAKDIRGCVDTVVKQACVPAEFDFSFAATNNCLFDSTNFSPLQMGTSTGKLVSFYWDFGDHNSGADNFSTKKSPSHYYNQPGKYTVSLSAVDIYNCSKIKYMDITILPLPVSYFTYTLGACDSSVYFNESSYSMGSEIRQWKWDFGDGITQTVVAPGNPDVSHQYVVKGTYSVSLTVSNATGCTAKTTVSDIVVKPCLTAAFELANTMICQNNIISFMDKSSSTNPTNEWHWDFGDGTHMDYSSYTNQITHKFNSAGTFRVQLILAADVAGRKVYDTAKMSVIVNPTPLPGFNSGVVCHEQTASFTNMTSGNGTKIISYNWTFGEPSSAPQDTSSLKNPTHLYKTPGIYDVTLAVKNSIGCTGSIQMPLIIHGLPEANYTYSASCAGNKTSFTDLSIAAVAPLVNWEWTFYNAKGVAGKTNIQNPDFIYTAPGDYVVNLKVTDIYGCMDTINQNVTTWSVPKSVFSYTENVKELQGQLQFNNLSEDATRYHWDFGNGTDSYAKDPVSFYENDGTYDITLITWNDKNCTDTLSKQYKFMVKGLYIPNAFSPTNKKTEVQLLKPVGINLDQYRFEVYDRWGSLIWWTDKLDASGRPTEGWDGTFKGSLLPEGAYPWRAFGIFKDGSIWEAVNVGNNDHLPGFKVGTATMIR